MSGERQDRTIPCHVQDGCRTRVDGIHRYSWAPGSYRYGIRVLCIAIGSGSQLCDWTNDGYVWASTRAAWVVGALRDGSASLSEQRAIARILATFDDKIELNRRMNETLEAMAQALFKCWFVDFEPVRAKSEGRDTGLPQDIADLFPDRLVDSEVGEIPAGWTVIPLDAIAQFQNGLALQKFRLRRTKLACLWSRSPRAGWRGEKRGVGECEHQARLRH